MPHRRPSRNSFHRIARNAPRPGAAALMAPRLPRRHAPRRAVSCPRERIPAPRDRQGSRAWRRRIQRESPRSSGGQGRSSPAASPPWSVAIVTWSLADLAARVQQAADGRQRRQRRHAVGKVQHELARCARKSSIEQQRPEHAPIEDRRCDRRRSSTSSSRCDEKKIVRSPPRVT